LTFLFWGSDAVSEHAFALASAVTRRILPMHQMVVEGDKWSQVRPPVMFGKPPRVNSEETLVSGYAFREVYFLLTDRPHSKTVVRGLKNCNGC